MHILCIWVQFGRFSFDFVFRLWRNSWAFLLSVERAFFAPLRHVVGRLAVLRARVTSHLRATVLVLATALRDSFHRFAVLISTQHIVVRVIVRFFAVLVPHFQVVNEFVLADFAALVFHRLHGTTNSSLSSNSTNVLTPLSLTNVALWLICSDWPFI